MQCSTSNGRTAASKCFALSNEVAVGLLIALSLFALSLSGGCEQAAAVPSVKGNPSPSQSTSTTIAECEYDIAVRIAERRVANATRGGRRGIMRCEWEWVGFRGV